MDKIPPFGVRPWNGVKPISRAFRIPLSGMSAQRQRMETIATNLANVDTAFGPNGTPYQRQVARLEAGRDGTVEVTGVDTLDTGFERVYDPDHPLADEDGYVRYPKIEIEQEIADLMITRRMFEANATVFEAAKAMVRQSLDI